MPAEIILVGGAALLANYRFREITYDIDAVTVASSAIKEAVNHVGDRLGLPNGWLNTDFVRTTSYTPRLMGVISEHSAGGKPLTIGQIKKAVCDLFGSWDVISTDMDEFLVSVVEQSNQPALHTKYREIENEDRKIILAYKQENAQGLRNEADVDSVLEKAKNEKR